MSITEDLPYTISWEQRLAQLAREHGKPFIYTIQPGGDKTYDYRTNERPPIIYRDPQGFKIYIEEVKKLPNPLKIIFLTSFNEWFEGTSVEPSRGYGLEYLKIIKEALGGR